MSASKKLSIAQLILNILIFIVAIILAYGIVNLIINSGRLDNYDEYGYTVRNKSSRWDFYLLITIVSAVFTFILNIGNLVVGILQIVYRSKESTSGVYLASGIIGIVMFFFITLGIPLAISMIILNSIGISKKNL